ncbi:MAG: type II secretion system F family protein [Bacilli bacterium]|nr:type II secretion system F family protein [Bacilli bacterium]
MNKQVLTVTMSQIIICSIFLILVFIVVKTLFSIKSERRIKAFALDDKTQDDLSIADLFLKFCLNSIKIFSKSLKKSQVLNDYAKHFEKYLIYNDNQTFKSIDYISLKFLVMFGIQILYVISLSIKYAAFSLPVFLIGSIIGFFSVDFIIIWLYKNHKKLIEQQLLQAIVMMNSAFKSGKNILQAISIVKKELPSPIKDEFSIIYTDLTYGLDINVCFERFYNRVKVEEAKYITSSLSLLSKTGGNIVTVFNMIEKNFYDRLKIKNELEALTSSSKFLYRMLISLPILFILVIVAMNPTYFNPLISTKIGYIIDLAILVLYVIYIMIIKRMMRVEEV